MATFAEGFDCTVPFRHPTRITLANKELDEEDLAKDLEDAQKKLKAAEAKSKWAHEDDKAAVEQAKSKCDGLRELFDKQAEQVPNLKGALGNLLKSNLARRSQLLEDKSKGEEQAAEDAKIALDKLALFNEAKRALELAQAQAQASAAESKRRGDLQVLEKVRMYKEEEELNRKLMGVRKDEDETHLLLQEAEKTGRRESEAREMTLKRRDDEKATAKALVDSVSAKLETAQAATVKAKKDLDEANAAFYRDYKRRQGQQPVAEDGDDDEALAPIPQEDDDEDQAPSPQEDNYQAADRNLSDYDKAVKRGAANARCENLVSLEGATLLPTPRRVAAPTISINNKVTPDGETSATSSVTKLTGLDDGSGGELDPSGAEQEGQKKPAALIVTGAGAKTSGTEEEQQKQPASSKASRASSSAGVASATQQEATKPGTNPGIVPGAGATTSGTEEEQQKQAASSKVSRASSSGSVASANQNKKQKKPAPRAASLVAAKAISAASAAKGRSSKKQKDPTTPSSISLDGPNKAIKRKEPAATNGSRPNQQKRQCITYNEHEMDDGFNDDNSDFFNGPVNKFKNKGLEKWVKGGDNHFIDSHV